MLFCSIKGSETAIPEGVAVELRIDLWPRIDLGWIKQLLSTRPVLLTVRSQAHGGSFRGSEAEREALLEELIALCPAFVDLEWDMRPEFLQAMLPRAQCILSYHNLHEVPADLERIYSRMRHFDAFSYKIAAHAQSTSDALRLLLFAKEHAKCSAICMGKQASFARVLGPVIGNPVGYACAKDGTAPGQLTLSELCAVYRYPSLNRETALFGLIGDPVEQSFGHLYHNAQFQRRGCDAVYVKMGVQGEELAAFLPLARALGIRGLSVTAPLKEKIVPFVDELDADAERIGAVNTLLFREGRLVGTNTDGAGALDAIEKRGPVSGKTVAILGAGGVARSIAFEAKARGASVWVMGRTASRAEALADAIGCAVGLPSRVDILINCTPNSPPIDFQPETLVMDCVYAPRVTPFLHRAALKGCQIIYGEEMFLNQAERQTAFWMGTS